MTKKLSPPQKWPGEYSVKGSFWDSDGRRLDIETDLPYNLWKEFIQKVTEHMRTGEIK